jgi:hypothetical protein
MIGQMENLRASKKQENLAHAESLEALNDRMFEWYQYQLGESCDGTEDTTQG